MGYDFYILIFGAATNLYTATIFDGPPLLKFIGKIAFCAASLGLTYLAAKATI